MSLQEAISAALRGSRAKTQQQQREALKFVEEHAVDVVDVSTQGGPKVRINLVQGHVDLDAATGNVIQVGTRGVDGASYNAPGATDRASLQIQKVSACQSRSLTTVEQIKIAVEAMKWP